MTVSLQRLVLLSLALGPSLSGCQGSTTPPGESVSVPDRVRAARPVVFENVTVARDDLSGVIAGQSVVVSGGRIIAVGPVGSVVAPPGAVTIAGRGVVYAFPGLVDAHAHLLDTDEVWLYLANGITTIRNLSGYASLLPFRDRILRGELDGPRIVTSGPILDGDPPMRPTNVVVRTAADARAAVRAHQQAGYDFIKVYDNLSLDAYRAVVAEATTLGLRVAGHLPTPVRLAAALTGPTQQIIEHTEELLPEFGPQFDQASPDDVARRLAAAGVWVTPTLGVFRGAVEMTRNWTALQQRTEVRYMNPQVRGFFQWDDVGRQRSGNAGAGAQFQRQLDFMQHRLVPALARAGVQLVAGADAPVAPLVPGFALHDELPLLAGAGLSLPEVLRAATSQPARLLGRENDFGSLKVGQSADIVLLAANPLTELSALRKPLGVMARGEWYAASFLQGALDSLARQYRAP